MYHQIDNRIIKLLGEGVEQGVFPGAAAAVSWGIGSARKRNVAVGGIKDSRYPNDMVTRDTCFDLASLSKALSTTLIIYSLINEQKISLDDSLQTLFKRNIASDKQNITIRLLLSHSSGLADYKSYFSKFAPELRNQKREENKDELLQLILSEPLAYTPGSKCLYSDLGFIILGHIIEMVTDTNLDINFIERIAAPLGIEKDIFYTSMLEAGIPLNKGNFAATEDCLWRGRVIHSEVHDEHCWLMNGVAGHAGLFGTIDGVLRLCEAIMDQWQGWATKPCLWSMLLQQGLQKQYRNQSWCLGFDSPSARGSSGGRYLSSNSVGHLGYAGTSFWIDPEKELVIVLLTNRVHPSRDNIKIRAFRPYFHDTIIEELCLDAL